MTWNPEVSDASSVAPRGPSEGQCRRDRGELGAGLPGGRLGGGRAARAPGPVRAVLPGHGEASPEQGPRAVQEADCGAEDDSFAELGALVPDPVVAGDGGDVRAPLDEDDAGDGGRDVPAGRLQGAQAAEVRARGAGRAPAVVRAGHRGGWDEAGGDR